MNIKSDTGNILIHTAILFIITVPFWLTGLDIKAQSFFFDFASNNWRFAGMPAVQILYNFGVYPGIIMTAIAAVLFGLSFAYKAMLKYRKISLLVMLTLFLGPALAINVIMKNYSGRPRPREIKEFNGRMEFRNVLQLGTPGRGHSFPCGHASMGFLFMGLYFALRKKNGPAAYAALFGGLLYGSAMGAARMAQGAHFLSDCIWAAGITFISAEIAWFKILGGEGKSVFDGIRAGKAGKKVSIAVITSLLAALVVIFLFSVPYAVDRHYKIGNAEGTLELAVYAEGSVRVLQQEADDSIVLKAAGFGFPKRVFDGRLSCTGAGKDMKCVFVTEKKGFFSELNSTIDVYLPEAKEYRITVNTSKGDIECSLTGAAPLVALTARRGDIDFKAGGLVKAVYIKTGKGSAEAAFDVDTALAQDTFIDVNVNGEFHLANRADFFRDLNTQAEKVSGSKELYYKSTKKGGPAMSVKARKIIIK